MRIRRSVLVGLVVCLGSMVAATATAHVPFLELVDFTCAKPFRPESPQQSIAVYAWLDAADDVDVYTFVVKEETPFLAEVLVPYHPQYANFRPAFAIIGKGLPKAPTCLPVRLAEGYGALVFLDDVSQKRTTFFEPFGNKSYYRGPRVERTLSPGTYTVVYWDPRHKKGDYVAVLGKKEIWRAKDIRRALRVTPKIRRGQELHLTETKERPAIAGDEARKD